MLQRFLVIYPVFTIQIVCVYGKVNVNMVGINVSGSKYLMIVSKNLLCPFKPDFVCFLCGDFTLFEGHHIMMHFYFLLSYGIWLLGIFLSRIAFIAKSHFHICGFWFFRTIQPRDKSCWSVLALSRDIFQKCKGICLYWRNVLYYSQSEFTSWKIKGFSLLCT